jgi:hypothetical protein
MSPHESAKILTEHNRWRRGQAPYDSAPPPEAPHTQQVIGEAIDTAIAFIHRREVATGQKALNPQTPRHPAA